MSTDYNLIVKPHPDRAPSLTPAPQPTPARRVWHWLIDPSSTRRAWLPAVVLGVIGFVLVHPFDEAINHAADQLARSLRGDLRRELFAWQQYGQGFSTIVIALAIWLGDPTRRRRLLDLLLALGIAQVVAQSMKMLIGRPRPRPQFEDPWTFLGPLGEYPIVVNGHAKLVHAWDTASGANTDLWSMPSSHTMFAAMLSVFIATLYPRLRWLLVGLTAMVGFGRVLFDAHWASDVVVGACAGFGIGALVSWHYLGVRLIDWLWKKLVDRDAQPALPGVLSVEAARVVGRSAE